MTRNKIGGHKQTWNELCAKVRTDNIRIFGMDDFWNSNLIDEHRRGINDFDWRKMQRISEPLYDVGDLVEFKAGGYGVITKVEDEIKDAPPMYATQPRKGLPYHSKGVDAWHYEGDIKRKVPWKEINKLVVKEEK